MPDPRFEALYQLRLEGHVRFFYGYRGTIRIPAVVYLTAQLQLAGRRLEPDVPETWWREETTPEEALAYELAKGSDLSGYPDWLKFIRWYEPTDALWRYSTPGEYWERLAGRYGYCIVTEGRVLEWIILVLN